MKPEDFLSIPGAKLCIEVRDPGYHTNLYYTSAELPSLSSAIITGHKEAAKAAHEAFVLEQSSRPAVKPSKEDLEAQKAEMTERIKQIDVAMLTAVSAVEEVIG